MGRALVMMSVFVRLAKILPRLLVEGFLATERAEVVGLAVVLGLARRALGRDVHIADGVFEGLSHKQSPFIVILLESLQIDESQIAYLQTGYILIAMGSMNK